MTMKTIEKLSLWGNTYCSVVCGVMLTMVITSTTIIPTMIIAVVSCRRVYKVQNEMAMKRKL